MFKVIELTDSEDEAQEATLPTKKPKLMPPEKKTAAQHLTEVLESKAAANASATPHNINQKSKSSPTTPVNVTTTVDSSVVTLQAPSSTVTNPLDITISSSSSSSSPTTKPGRQRSRKAQHQTMRLSPDMQFETITLDDEDQIQPIILKLPTALASTTTTATSTVTSSMPQQIFIAPATQISSANSGNPKQIRHKPVMDKVCRDSLVKRVAEVFISRPDTSTVIRQIAQERIRINYLLAVFNMQEMSFTISSHIEMLRFQFRDRLKQRRQQIMTGEHEQQVHDKQIRQLQMEQESLMQRDPTEDLNDEKEGVL